MIPAVNIRKIRREVLQGQLVLTVGIVEARSEFQRRRLRQAVAAVQLYLEGGNTRDIATILDKTVERTAQVIKLGIGYMESAGWLKPPAISPNKPDASPPKTAESGQCLN